MFTEKQCDAMDNARDEQKERQLDAKQRQAIPVVASAAVAQLRVFDALMVLGYSMATFFESRSPGVATTLRVWAAANGIVIDTRVIDEQTTVISADVDNGPQISVQYATEVAP